MNGLAERLSDPGSAGITSTAGKAKAKKEGGASTRDASDASDKDSTGSTYHTLKRAEAKPRKGTVSTPQAAKGSKRNVGGFRGNKKVKDPGRKKKVGISARRRAAFLQMSTQDQNGVLSDVGDGKKRKADSIEGTDQAPKRLRPSSLTGSASCCTLGDEDPCPPQLLNLEEKQPRDRGSKTTGDRAKIEEAHHDIDNKVSPMPRMAYGSWTAIETAIKDYEKSTMTHYRVRTSESVEDYNDLYSDQLPVELEYSFRTYRCINSVYQASRSKGNRSKNSGYTGCKARFTTRFVNIASAEEDRPKWRIIVESEYRTHNHPTTAGTYARVKDIPQNSKVLQTASLLADAKASTKEIGRFLTRRLGQTFTPQQTKNLLLRIGNNKSSQDRLKLLLDTLVQVQGNDVMLIQDQLDVTCGIIIQTAAQKVCFDHWGQTLAMDWTHSTNNLGFHLGSLVATTPSGRGVPVFDFMALNEKACTLKIIFDYFKRTNAKWKQVESFVIDKHFVEWRVLECCFPTATVLLCQFHAITYWKKLLGKRRFYLNSSEKDQVQRYFADMLYSSTSSRFEQVYSDFARFCEPSHRMGVKAYFDKNWKSCVPMWANFERSKCFSAGNTTTNRIESNWHQLKMVLGKRTSIDKTVTAILQHQAHVLNQIAHGFYRNSCSSRPPISVPSFLRNISGAMSDYVLGKVRRRWDIFVIHGSKMTVVAVPKSCDWEVWSNGRMYVCNDSQWTCSCWFYTSQRLPCEHMMVVARDGKGFSELPKVVLHKRWNMSHAATLHDVLDKGASSILSVVDSVNLNKKFKTEVPGENAIIPEYRPLQHEEGIALEELANSSELPNAVEKKGLPGKKVAVVELAREQRGDLAILSSREKYNYAVACFQPVVTYLQNLGSAKFYRALEFWERMVHQELKGLADLKTEVGADDDNDSDTMSMLDPADLATMLQDVAMWAAPSGTDNVTQPDSDLLMQELFRIDSHWTSPSVNGERTGYDERPPLSRILPTNSKTPVRYQVNVNELEKSVGTDNASAPVRSSSIQCSSPASAGTFDALGCEGLDRMNLPSPVVRGRPKQEKVKYWASKASSKRNETSPSQPAGITVDVIEIVHWSKHTNPLRKVSDILERYPVSMNDRSLRGRAPIVEESTRADARSFCHTFVIPDDLVKSLTASLLVKNTGTNHKMQPSLRNEIVDVDSSQENASELTVKFKAEGPVFSSSCVDAMMNFYVVRKTAAKWKRDMAWLTDDWLETSGLNVELFASEVETTEMSEKKLVQRHCQLAKDVISGYETSCLQSNFSIPSTKTTIFFWEVVGYLAGSEWMNDSTVNYTLQAIARGRSDVLVLASHVLTKDGFPKRKQPKALSDLKIIILPVNHHNTHWSLIMVTVNYAEGRLFSVHFYDPLSGQPYKAELERIWKSNVWPFIHRWHVETVGGNDPIFDSHWINTPDQPDGSSCGVLVTATAYSYVRGLRRFELERVSHTSVKVMRLRMLWIILCSSVRSTINGHAAILAASADEKVTAEFMKTKK